MCIVQTVTAKHLHLDAPSFDVTQVDAGNGRKLINEAYPSGWGYVTRYMVALM